MLGRLRRRPPAPPPVLERIALGLTEELRDLRPDCPPVHISLDGDMPVFDAEVRRAADHLHLVAGARPDVQVSLNFLESRGATLAWWLLNASDTVDRLSVSLSDGDQPTLASCAFSSHDPAHLLLPDPYFFRRRAYFKIRRHISRHPVPWEERSDALIWRGQYNGQGLFSLSPDHVAHMGVKQRLRLAVKAHGLPGVDVRFVQDDKSDAASLRAADLLGDPMRMVSWKTRRFAIDIDGYSNAWSNLLQRFHLGCCVFKVDSAFGFRQWYYDQLVPFETHIPIRADLSDLEEKLDWARTNDAQCREIAANGQALAQSLDFDSVTQWAGAEVTRRLG